jgi:hypothetical protein
MKTRNLTFSKADNAIHLGQAYFNLDFLSVYQKGSTQSISVCLSPSRPFLVTHRPPWFILFHFLSSADLSLSAPLQNYISGGDPQAATVVSSLVMPPRAGLGIRVIIK